MTSVVARASLCYSFFMNETKTNLKIGLVMAGGAMRGMFTAGVLDVFMENSIEFDGAIGVSAGATFGCNFKSRQIGRAIRYNKRFAHDWRYCSFRSLLLTGDLYGADFCYDRLPNSLDILDVDSYKNNPMEFYCVASDCVTGLPVYKKLETCDKNDLTWMRASASMPLVSRPVEIDGYKLLDGGMSDPVPFEYFESLGYTKNVVILTQPLNYKKKRSSLFPLMKILLKKYPLCVKALSLYGKTYNDEIERLIQKADRGEVLVICPEYPLQISRTEHNPERLDAVYEYGRIVASSMLGEVRKFLESAKKPQ